MGERWLEVESTTAASSRRSCKSRGRHPSIFHHGSPGSAQPFAPFDQAAAERAITIAFPSRAGFGDRVARRGGRRRARRRTPPRSPPTSATIGSSPPAGPAEGRTRSRARPSSRTASSRPRRSPASLPSMPKVSTGPPGWGRTTRSSTRSPRATRPPRSNGCERMRKRCRGSSPTRSSTSSARSSRRSTPRRSPVSSARASRPRSATPSGTGLGGWFDDDQAFVHDWGFDLASIRVPLFVWQGRPDLMVPITHGEWLCWHIPTARVHLRRARAPLARARLVRRDPRRAPRCIGRRVLEDQPSWSSLPSTASVAPDERQPSCALSECVIVPTNRVARHSRPTTFAFFT